MQWLTFMETLLSHPSLIIISLIGFFLLTAFCYLSLDLIKTEFESLNDWLLFNLSNDIKRIWKEYFELIWVNYKKTIKKLWEYFLNIWSQTSWSNFLSWLTISIVGSIILLLLIYLSARIIEIGISIAFPSIDLISLPVLGYSYTIAFLIAIFITIIECLLGFYLFWSRDKIPFSIAKEKIPIKSILFWIMVLLCQIEALISGLRAGYLSYEEIFGKVNWFLREITPPAAATIFYFLGLIIPVIMASYFHTLSKYILEKYQFIGIFFVSTIIMITIAIFTTSGGILIVASYIILSGIFILTKILNKLILFLIKIIANFYNRTFIKSFKRITRISND